MDDIDALRAEVEALRKQVAGLTAKAEPERVLKIDEGRRMVFGWSYVARRPDGTQVVDISGDVVDTPERLRKMEDAAYGYVLKSRAGDVSHDGKPVATLVESVVFTPEKVAKMGLPDTWAPHAWWAGWKITDEPTFERVLNGELAMLSVGGRGQRTLYSPEP